MLNSPGSQIYKNGEMEKQMFFSCSQNLDLLSYVIAVVWVLFYFLV